MEVLLVLAQNSVWGRLGGKRAVSKKVDMLSGKGK